MLRWLHTSARLRQPITFTRMVSSLCVSHQSLWAVPERWLGATEKASAWAPA
jgi:hypothetical protein